jgi:hypothetical protein
MRATCPGVVLIVAELIFIAGIALAEHASAKVLEWGFCWAVIGFPQIIAIE